MDLVPPPLIDVRRVGKRCTDPTDAESTWALADVSFSVAAGAATGVLGRNGAGKSTLLAIVGGRLDADEGQVFIAGVDARSDPAVQRRTVAVVADRTGHVGTSTVREHLEGAARAAGLEGRRTSAEIERVIVGLDLEPVVGRRLASMDRGVRRRTVLAAALLSGCDALLVDEPTRGLDPEATHVLLECLRAIAHDDVHTLVIATHDLAVVRGLCRRVVVLDRGRVLAVDATRTLLRPADDPVYRVVVSNVSAALPSRLATAFGGSTIDLARHHGTITTPFDHADDLYDLLHVLETEGAVIESIDRVDATLDDVLRLQLTPAATYARMRGWRRT